MRLLLILVLFIPLVSPAHAADVEIRPTVGVLHYGPTLFWTSGVEASLWSGRWHGLMTAGFFSPLPTIREYDWLTIHIGSRSWAEIGFAYNIAAPGRLTFGPAVSLLHFGTAFFTGFGLEATYTLPHLNIRLTGGQLHLNSVAPGTYEAVVAQQGYASWAELAVSWRF